MVRCPACSREHSFTPPTFPCACGAPLTVPILAGPVARLDHRTWDDSWVAVRCHSCGRRDHLPTARTRLPVWHGGATAGGRGAGGDRQSARDHGRRRRGRPGAHPTPSSAVLRPAFHPVTIRTGWDVVTAAAQYLKWLGFTSMRRVEDRAPSGVDLRGPGIVAQVGPTTRPTGVRDVECLWLHGLSEAAVSVFFSLAGYARIARSRVDELYLPLFVMDLTGTPQPVNDPADDLIRMGPREV